MARTSIKADRVKGTISLVMSIDDAQVVAEALSYARLASMDDYGSGWYTRSDEGREARRQWKRLDKIEKRLIAEAFEK